MEQLEQKEVASDFPAGRFEHKYLVPDRVAVAIRDALLPHLDAGGTRTTVLAERVGMTKQGMGQLVGELERQGFLRRAPDPADGRAALVQFTEAGLTLLDDAIAVTQEMDAGYEALLGGERFAELKVMLQRIGQRGVGRGSPG